MIEGIIIAVIGGLILGLIITTCRSISLNHSLTNSQNEVATLRDELMSLKKSHDDEISGLKKIHLEATEKLQKEIHDLNNTPFHSINSGPVNIDNF